MIGFTGVGTGLSPGLSGDRDHQAKPTRQAPVPGVGVHRPVAASSRSRGGEEPFYGLDRDLLAAASEQSPNLPSQADREPDVDDWLANQTPETLRALMRRVLQDDAAAVRAESLAAMRNQSGKATWPANDSSRTLEQLRELAGEKADRRKRREQASEQRKLRRRLAKLRDDPSATIAEAEKLIGSRSTANYRNAAKLLAELRDAVGGEEGSRIADQAARQIAKKFPTLRNVKRAFKEEGLNCR